EEDPDQVPSPAQAGEGQGEGEPLSGDVRLPAGPVGPHRDALVLRAAGGRVGRNLLRAAFARRRATGGVAGARLRGRRAIADGAFVRFAAGVRVDAVRDRRDAARADRRERRAGDRLVRVARRRLRRALALADLALAVPGRVAHAARIRGRA